MYKQLSVKNKVELVSFDSKFYQTILKEKIHFFGGLKCRDCTKFFNYLESANNKKLKGINSFIESIPIHILVKIVLISNLSQILVPNCRILTSSGWILLLKKKLHIIQKLLHGFLQKDDTVSVH